MSEIAKSPRLHALDTVRGTALLLGIFFHATLSFTPGPQIWFIMDSQRSPVMSETFYVLHLFRMTSFFILAGFFGRMSYHRLGLGGFIKDRLKRIAVPLVVFWPVIMASFIALGIWAFIVANGGVMPDNPPPPQPMTWQTFPLTHLWFLYVLLMFYAAMLIARGMVAMVDRKEWLRNDVSRLLGAALRNPLFVLILAVPTAAALYYQPNWMVWFGTPTPDKGFIPNAAALVAYGTAFTLGWIMERRIEAITALKKYWLVNLVVGTAAAAYALHIAGVAPSFTMMAPGLDKAIYVSTYALAMWCLTFAFVGGAQHLFAGESRIRRYIADSSYWLYIIHLPLIVALQIWVSGWDWPWAAKYGFIMGVSLPLMLLSYHFLVRYTFIGGVLNGKRKQRAAR